VVGAKRESDTLGAHGTAFGMLSRSRVPVLCVPANSGWGQQPESLAKTAAR